MLDWLGAGILLSQLLGLEVHATMLALTWMLAI